MSIGTGSETIKGTSIELPKLKSWTVIRNVLDPTKGDRGLMRFVVLAPTAAEAASLVDAQAAPIRKAFMKRAGITLDLGEKRGRKKKSGKGARRDDER